MTYDSIKKQRLLIARAVYKNPEFIFFDEATSFLDTKNESLFLLSVCHMLESSPAHRIVETFQEEEAKDETLC